MSNEVPTAVMQPPVDMHAQAAAEQSREGLVQMDLRDFMGYIAAQAAVQLQPQQLQMLYAHDAVLAEHRIGRVDAYFGAATEERNAYLGAHEEVEDAQRASDIIWRSVQMNQAGLQAYAGYLDQQRRIQEAVDQAADLIESDKKKKKAAFTSVSVTGQRNSAENRNKRPDANIPDSLAG